MLKDGLLWAIKEAMFFYNLSQEIKAQELERIMTQCADSFNHLAMESQYIHLYEKNVGAPTF